MSAKSLAEKLLAGNRRALGRAITLVESTRTDAGLQKDQLLQTIMPRTGQSVRLGISGSPGVCKSTFIESVGSKLIEQGYKLAILAIDPSSPKTKGSILGDKTRMQDLAADQRCFIRPSPAGRSLGGVARRTRESILLCEAAGYNFIIVETVGVGQSEVAVAGMVDQFIYLQLPNSGDDLQGIKKGIIELADSILINKADSDHLNAAKRSKVDLELALNLLYKNNTVEKPKVQLVSAKEKTGIDTFLDEVFEKITALKDKGDFSHRRSQQAIERFKSEVSELVLETVSAKKAFRENYLTLEKEVESMTLSPTTAAKQFIGTIGI